MRTVETRDVHVFKSYQWIYLNTLTVLASIIDRGKKKERGKAEIEKRKARVKFILLKKGVNVALS